MELLLLERLLLAVVSCDLLWVAFVEFEFLFRELLTLLFVERLFEFFRTLLTEDPCVFEFTEEDLVETELSPRPPFTRLYVFVFL